MTVKRMLFSLAHPDDESFGWGGLIRKYVDQGIEVDYICATDGARGTIAQEHLDTYGSPRAVRYAELDCASKVLGFSEVYKFDYLDSGMMGSPENDDPDCLWQADETEVVAKIVTVMRERQPQVVVTFDPFGGYGHPDHIFMHKATTRAFYAAGDPAQFSEQGAPYTPQKLYYTGFSRGLLRLWIVQARMRGQNPRQMGVNKDIDLMEIRDNILPATTKIDISDYLDTWNEASRCHASQLNPRMLMSGLMQKMIMSKQLMTCVVPERSTKLRQETDLFAGVV